MERLPRVPFGGRCTCGATLWHIRAADAGQPAFFVCRRYGCGRRYLPRQDQWAPVDDVLKQVFIDLEHQVVGRLEEERSSQNE